MYGKFVLHCHHLFPTVHPPYALARAICVFTVLGLYLSIYVGYYFYFISNVKKFDDFDTFICYAMVCLVNSCVILLSYSECTLFQKM